MWRFLDYKQRVNCAIGYIHSIVDMVRHSCIALTANCNTIENGDDVFAPACPDSGPPPNR